MSVQQCGGSNGTCPCRLSQSRLFDAKDKRVREAMATTRSNDNDAVPRGGGPGIVAASELLFSKNFRLSIVHEQDDGMWVCSECGHGIGVHAVAAARQDGCDRVVDCRGAANERERRLAKMVVQLVGDTSNNTASGCVISSDGYVVSTKHQLMREWSSDDGQTSSELIEETYTARMINEEGDVAERTYNYYPDVVDDIGDADLALFYPAEPLDHAMSYFEHRVLAHHNDDVWTGGRIDDGATFMLGAGYFNYITPNSAMTTAHGDKGWSGGAVFRWHNQMPSLVGLVRGPYTFGGQEATRVQLLTPSLLSDTTEHPLWLRSYASAMKLKEERDTKAALRSCTNVTDPVAHSCLNKL